MTLLSSERIYSGRMLNLDRDTVRFPNGNTGTLEMVRHPGAAAVLPFLDDPATTADPRVVLIRQFRHAAGGYIWEVPAGKLDAGEADDPARCAARELAEETGYTARRFERLTTIYTTPGFTDERIHLFAAYELEAGTSEREADEFLEIHAVPWTEVLRKVQSGELMDGKSLAAILFVEAFR